MKSHEDLSTTPTSSSGPTRRRVVTGVAAAAAAVGAAGWGVVPGISRAAAAPSEAQHALSPVGFVLSHEQFQTDDLVRWGAQAEAAGFGYLWTSDHIQPWEDVQGHSMHPWLTQALLTRATSRATFGTGVTCPTYRHHPSEVAQAWASLGILAPGRVFLGVGAGEALNEKAATGSFQSYDVRAARLVEAVQLIRRLWTGERVTHTGTYYSVDSFKLYDLPEALPPIYMAASGPHSAYNAGRYGDGWIGSAKDHLDPVLQRAFRRGAVDSGRDPDRLHKLAELFVNVDLKGDPGDLRYAATRWRFTVNPWLPALLYEPNPVRIQQKAERRWTLPQVYASWPKGEAKHHIAGVQQLLDHGVTPFVHSGQRDQAAVLDFYGNQVLPQLRV